MNTVSLSAPVAGRRRRRHSAQFKAEVVGACRQPGVSIAAIALANGLNANLLRRWVIDAEQTRTTSAKVESSVRDAAGQAGALASFVPVGLDPTPSPPDIRIELNRNATLVAVTWPSGAAAECGAWLREVLR
jgi:transposase-like protein